MCTSGNHHSGWSIAVTWLYLTLGVLIGVAFLLFRARFWPMGPCWWCRGRAGRGLWSTKKAYNRCHFCGGSGRRIRPISRIYRKWKEEAKR